MTLTDHFAERLSRHGNIAKAATTLGMSESWGRAQFKKICKALGPQAV